ncbi:hypothetical protein HOD20_01000 [archaeon]|jgi:hypothetical protein|nr:hypothetical protein [archaeon]MBT4351081.1 hypothetical protein [archaeon]MBT4646933.1 hypothetical protein [archaeon]MBT6820799.1 hypothetical protein [archaeon]MBT7392116.1 hypothetical protein [archaeon]
MKININMNKKGLQVRLIFFAVITLLILFALLYISGKMLGGAGEIFAKIFGF